MASTVPSVAKIGILSIGDMGGGLAKLLVAKGFQVATNYKGRSEDTIERAREANVENIPSDAELVQQCSVILSVVPPRDATETAQRVIDALSGARKDTPPLYFAELNAVSPSTCRRIAALFEKAQVPVRFVDGCILGGPPSLKTTGGPGTNASSAAAQGQQWSLPSTPVSGPHKLSDIPGFGQHLFDTLNMRHISDEVGAASGLKMCFASTTKGFTAIGIQAFTTAHRLGVLDQLKAEMSERIPNHLKTLQWSVTTMPPKAYRWVREMEEISQTHAEDGGFEPYLFRGVAGAYRAVAEDTVLGDEKIGKRKRGTTMEDVAAAMAEGLEKKKKKME